MAWYRLSFHPSIVNDLATVDRPTAQRLLDKTKWIASNAENLRHEAVGAELPGVAKYAVGDWRFFYVIDKAEELVTIHAVVRRTPLR